MATSEMGRVLQFRPRRSARTTVHPAPAAPVMVTMRISLDDVESPIWRVLDVLGDLTLDVFHQVVNRAMGWQDCHLHRFSTDAAHPYETYFLTDVDVREGDHGVEESAVRVDQVLGGVGSELTYLYDFGDGWQHTITVTSTRPAADGAPIATCLDGQGACPLEDCGGIDGHAEILDAFRTDPSRLSWPEILRDWVPADYDPDEFDTGRTNLLLALIGATGVEILDALGGAAVKAGRAAALDDVVARLNPPEVAIELAALAKDAASSNGGEPDVALAVRPWQVLLDLAADGGIPLTPAGWMKPNVVLELAERTGLLGDWIGSCTREQHTPPLANLREFTQTAGLLRKYKGRLLLTKLGRSALISPDRLALAVAGGLMGSRQALAHRHAAVLYLMAVAAGRPEEEAREFTARWMLELRWMTTTAGRDVPLSVHDIRGLLGDAGEMLAWADGAPLSVFRTEYGPNARRLARLALWPH